jgi:hypothetical protein
MSLRLLGVLGIKLRSDMLRFGWLSSELADHDPGSAQVPDEPVDIEVLASNPDREMVHSRESMTATRFQPNRVGIAGIKQPSGGRKPRTAGSMTLIPARTVECCEMLD